MSEAQSEWIDRIDALRVWKSGGRRAPHKPLLLLWAIGQVMRGKREFEFESVEESLGVMLNSFGPQTRGKTSPELPYWHLQSDGLWELNESESLERSASGFPLMAALRGTRANLPARFETLVRGDAAFRRRVVHQILSGHFPASVFDDILVCVGLTDTLEEPSSPPTKSQSRPTRDPAFRTNVMLAYEHRCAVTGFRASLGGHYFGVEAAHVMWHAQGGPDTVANGLVLEPTMHKLFDRGAWTLTDDRRVIVSSQFSGTDEATAVLRSKHGATLRSPLPGFAPPGADFIRWHRESDRGGVFRHPGLPLSEA